MTHLTFSVDLIITNFPLEEEGLFCVNILKKTSRQLSSYANFNMFPTNIILAKDSRSLLIRKSIDFRTEPSYLLNGYLMLFSNSNNFFIAIISKFN